MVDNHLLCWTPAGGREVLKIKLIESDAVGRYAINTAHLKRCLLDSNLLVRIWYEDSLDSLENF